MSSNTWLEYGIDVRNRTIRLFGEVDYSMAEQVVTGIHMMRGLRPIQLLICSEGGDDDACRAIVGAIRTCRAPVYGHVIGIAESAAAWFLQVCHRRIMYPHSSLMLHMGESTKNKHSRYIDKLFVDDVYSRVLEKDPNYPRNKLVSQLGDDWNVYPSQALELGLCDEVVSGPR